jgi:hypothetical protein
VLAEADAVASELMKSGKGEAQATEFASAMSDAAMREQARPCTPSSCPLGHNMRF